MLQFFHYPAKQFLLLLLVVFTLASNSVTAQTTATDTTAKTNAIGTSKIWGTVDGIQVEGMVQGPSAAVAPLQVACVFEYTEGDIFNSPPALPAQLNGMVHLDEALKGIITDLRKTGKFAGHAYETLLLTPPPGTLKAQKLLLIGMGNRTQFTTSLMTNVGTVALREALALGVTHFAFASDIKDAGIDSPTAEVAGNVVKGILQAYRTQAYLKSKKMASYKPLTKVTLLAGPDFFTIAGQGIREALATFNN